MFLSKQLTDFINANFICYFVNGDEGSNMKICMEHAYKNKNTIRFIIPESVKVSKEAEKWTRLKFLVFKGEGYKTWSYYLNEYKKGNRGFEFLNDFIVNGINKAGRAPSDKTYRQLKKVQDTL